MSKRSITVYVPPKDYEWITVALQALADDVITNEEAGQRGAKLSKLFQMIATAYIGNVGETIRIMQEIKGLTRFL